MPCGSRIREDLFYRETGQGASITSYQDSLKCTLALFANGLFAYGAGNLIGSAVNPPTSSGGTPYIVTSANALLGRFGDHGDGVNTFSLLPGSPAIGTGLPGGQYEPIDGRGYPRSDNNKWDIGA